MIRAAVTGAGGFTGQRLKLMASDSDNARLRQVLRWEPGIALEEGLARTYVRIEDQLRTELARMRPREAAPAAG
jgi:hypothetical protein